MSCSRLSWFLTATSMAANRRRIASGRPDAEAAAAVRRSRPTRGRRRRGRRRSRQSPLLEQRRGCPTRRRRARDRTPAGRRRRGRARSSAPVGSSRPATRATASSSRSHEAGEGVAEEPGDAHVTSIRGRPSSASGIGLDADDAARLRLPQGPDAEQRQRLGDVVALGAHRRRAPDHQPDRSRVGAVLGEVARRRSASARRRPTSQASGDGSAFGSTE